MYRNKVVTKVAEHCKQDFEMIKQSFIYKSLDHSTLMQGESKTAH